MLHSRLFVRSLLPLAAPAIAACSADAPALGNPTRETLPNGRQSGARGPGVLVGGDYLRTIVRRGEGPGEILRTNGIILSGDTLLWVNETRQWAVIGVDPAGEELRRFTSPVLSRGYIWEGRFDRLGRFWKETAHTEPDTDHTA